MSDDDYHPELAGYVPHDDGPVRRPGTLRIIRIVIVIGIVSLVLPGIIYTVGVQVQTADAACRIVVQAQAPEAVGSVARLELWGGNGPGWYCYAQSFNGSELMVRALGLIPGLSYQPSGTPA